MALLKFAIGGLSEYISKNPGENHRRNLLEDSLDGIPAKNPHIDFLEE